MEKDLITKPKEALSKDISVAFLRNSSFLLLVIIALMFIMVCSSSLFNDANRTKDNLTTQSEKISSVISRLERIPEIVPLWDLVDHQSPVVNLIEDGINYQINDLSNELDIYIVPSTGKTLLYWLAPQQPWFTGVLPEERLALHTSLLEKNRLFQRKTSASNYTKLLEVTNQNAEYLRQQIQDYNDYLNKLPTLIVVANAIIFLFICCFIYLLWFRYLRSVVNRLEERNTYLADQAKQLDYLAYNDVVTAAKNRQYFSRSINAMVTNNDGQLPFSVIHVDINRFKLINDTYGHKAGDYVLQAISRLLINAFPKSVVSRTGADEFLIINQGSSKASLQKTLHSIVEKSREPITYNGQVLTTLVNIGVTTFPNDGRSISELLRNLQDALNEAKKMNHGDGDVVFYEDMDVSKTNLPMPAYVDLINAIAKDEFIVFYSPLFDISTMRIIGAEALLRWNHPRFGGINIEHLIKVAEQMGLIARITDVVLRDITELHHRLFREFSRHFKLSINFSGGSREINEQIKSTMATIKQHPSLAHNLVVEITEKVIFGTRGLELSESMEPLRKMGVHISLDDFGTGFASLTHLMEVKFDSLKIDRSFVMDMLDSDTANNIVKSMVSLGRALDKEVVAEGIEDNEYLEALHELGCTTGQGYLMSKPIPKASFIDLLKDQNP